MDEQRGTVDPPGDPAGGRSGITLPRDLRSGPVLVGVDGVDTAGRALRAGAFLAACLGRSLVIVHVRRRLMPLADGYIPLGDELQLDKQVEQELDAELTTAVRLSGDLDQVRWELVCSYGEAAAELIRIGLERDAACVVVGRRPAGLAELVHRITSGSVSRAVVASHAFPVLVVP